MLFYNGDVYCASIVPYGKAFCSYAGDTSHWCFTRENLVESSTVIWLTLPFNLPLKPHLVLSKSLRCFCFPGILSRSKSIFTCVPWNLEVCSQNECRSDRCNLLVLPSVPVRNIPGEIKCNFYQELGDLLLWLSVYWSLGLPRRLVWN